tara:strand:+ start:155 stop:463 length:309 start_codon:yes stop_codon:yes gene_type:complete
MPAKKFFKKVGRGVQSAIGEGAKSVGKGAGMVLGTAAANYALEAAPLLLMKTGGYVPGSRNMARKAILHGGETVLPYGIKPTKQQRDAIDKNLKLQKIGRFY